MRKLFWLCPLGLSFLLTAAQPEQDLSQLKLPLQKGPSSVQAFKGKVIYLDIWATWCAPCQKSMPWMSVMQKRYQDQGLEVIAISIDQKPEKLADFIAKNKPTLTLGHDPSMEIAKILDIQSMPCALIIDRQGKLRAVHKGFRTEDTQQLEAQIQTLLKEK